MIDCISRSVGGRGQSDGMKIGACASSISVSPLNPPTVIPGGRHGKQAHAI
jgi:hypothetical protein